MRAMFVRTIPLHECIVVHATVAFLLFVVVGVSAALTQPYWAPFDKWHGATAKVEGRSVTITMDLEVFNRYPVFFDSRLVHTETGEVEDLRVQGPKTGKLKRFPLTVRRVVPEGAPSGEWCYVVQGVVEYNAWVTRVQSYPHVCFQVRE